MRNSTENTTTPSASDRRTRRRSELTTFFILAFGIWPILAVAAVGGFGFMVWMYQIIAGSPGPPA